MSLKKLLSVTVTLVMMLTIFSIVPINNDANGLTIYDSNKVSYSFSNPSKDSEIFTGLGSSVVTGNPKIQRSESLDKGATWGDYTSTSVSRIECLYDSETSLDMMGSGFKGWASHDGSTDNGNSGIITEYHCGDNPSNKRYRFDVIYDLKTSTAIKDILLIHSNSAVLRTGHYAIFVSDSLDTLFNSENRIFEYKNDNKNNTVSKAHKITVNNGMQAKYVAARIYNPYATDDFETLAAHPTTKMQTNCYVRLLEFNVFGADDSYSIKRTQHNTLSNYTSTLQLKNNLIKGNHCVSSFVYRNSSQYPLSDVVKENGVEVTDKFPNHTALTDDSCNFSIETRSIPNDKGYFSSGHTASGNGYKNTVIDNENELYYQFNYQLDDSANISGVTLVGHQNSLLTPSHFKFSIANSESALFTNQATYTSPDLYTSVSTNEISLKTTKQGKYVGFRIICGVGFDSETVTSYKQSQLYLRMAELCVYGTYVDYIGSLTQYSKIEPLNKMVNEPATIEYMANPDSSGRYPKTTLVNVKAAPSVRDGRDLYVFSHWIDNSNNGAIIGNSTTLQGLTLPQNITAVYGAVNPENTVTYTFTDKFGNELHKATVVFGECLSRAEYDKANRLVPDIAGYKKQEEEIKVGSRTATLQMWSQDVYNLPAETDITVAPLYKVGDETYTVSTETKKVPFDTKVTLAANKNHYVNGVIWQNSINSTTTTYVVGDMDITQKSTGSNGISLYNPDGKNSPTLQNGNFTAFAKLNLSSGTTITECGVIFLGNTPNLATDSSFNIANAAQKIVAKTPSGNHFSCTLKGVGKNRTRYARAYVKYGNQTVYSNIISVTTE